MTLNTRRLAAGALCLLLVLPAVPARAVEPNDQPNNLTLEQIMADPDWIGNPPENPYWSDDGGSIYYERRARGEPEPRGTSSASTSRAGSRRRGRSIPSTAAGWTPRAANLDQRTAQGLRAPGGRLRQGPAQTGDVRQITRTDGGREPSRTSWPTAGGRVPPRRRGLCLRLRRPACPRSRPTLKLDKDPAEKDEPSYLAEQQTRLFDVLRQKQEQEKREREEEPGRRRRPTPPGRPSPCTWARGSRSRASPSPPPATGSPWSPRPSGTRARPSREDAAVRHRERQRRDPRRPRQGRRRGAGAHSVILLDLRSTSGTTSTSRPSCRGSRTTL